MHGKNVKNKGRSRINMLMFLYFRMTKVLGMGVCLGLLRPTMDLY